MGHILNIVGGFISAWARGFHIPLFYAIQLLLLIHFVADFLLQNDWMALNKSKWCEENWDGTLYFQEEGVKALLSHTLVYAASFFLFGPKFVFLTFLLHTLTDAITSKWTTRLWFITMIERPSQQKNDYGDFVPYASYDLYAFYDNTKRHWFFVVIGLDQLIHGVTLLWTLKAFNL